MNYDDSIVTVSWKEVADGCNSFTDYKLFANQNGGSFSLIATIPTINTVEYPHKLNDLNTTRSYYLVVSSSCNGLEDYVSDTLSVDLTYPSSIGLDSVSVDINNQQIVAGWKPNPSPDTKGYQVYDFRSGNGDSIGYTTTTSFIVADNPANPFPVVIASIDSCNLSSLLSPPHQIMKLGSQIDTCKREITLNWSRYQGWASIDSVRVYNNINGSGFTLDTSLSGSSTSRTLRNVVLGNSYDFYVRAYYNTVSSSSNRTLIVTRKLAVPETVYVNSVSVNGQSIDIQASIDNERDHLKLRLLRGLSQENLVFYDSVDLSGSNTYRIYDNQANVNEERYFYQIASVNKCNETTLESNISSNILLTSSENEVLSYNPYVGWMGSVEGYSVENKSYSSTWNETSFHQTSGTYTSDSLQGCFRIVANESSNPIFVDAVSVSNEVCFQQNFTVFAPTAINFTSDNNRFVVLGYGIDHTRSTYAIYNRWGEKIVEQPTNQDWDGRLNGQLISNGVYSYIVTAYSLDDQRKILTNSLYVIR